MRRGVVRVLGNDLRSLRAAHRARGWADDVELEVVRQHAEDLEGTEHVEEFEPVEQHDADVAESIGHCGCLHPLHCSV
jgi:hypothetical protein